MITRLERAYEMIQIAEKKEAEGDARRAHMAYETAIRDFMHLSFVDCVNIEQVRSWLSPHPLDHVTSRFVHISENIIDMHRSELAVYFQGGNYLVVAFSHFFAALEQHDRAAFFARIGAESVLFTNPFWGEFGKMYGALLAGRTYSPHFGKLHFAHKYAMPYVDLMSAVMHGAPTDSATAEIDRQFVIRNADQRMSDVDAYMIEGSPESPVKFDFRKAGLLATIAKTNLRALA